jgi:hypothetical protein
MRYCQIDTESGRCLTVSIDGLVDTETAARLLGVSARRVNQLADTGDIAKAARGLYDRLSIERHLIARRGHGERAWDARTAWAAIAILSGQHIKIDWLGERSIYRLEAVLRTAQAQEVVSKARGRATVKVFTGHPSAAKVIRGVVVSRDWQVLGLAEAADEGADGYVSAAELESVIKKYALVASSSGNITLRATDFDMKTVASLVDASDVLVALDAAGSVDTRSRGTGELVVERALARLRDRRGWNR